MVSRFLFVLAVFQYLVTSTPMAQTEPAELRGVVTGVTGNPIEGVEILVVGPGLMATTDAAGQFAVRGIAEAQYVVRVRRIGYKAQQFGADLRGGTVKEVEIILETGAYELPEVAVTARALKPIEYGWTTRYDDFFRRRRVGLGYFFTRADIQRKSPYQTPNILAGIPGVHLRFRQLGPRGTDVEFIGCDRVSVWVDGWKLRPDGDDTVVAKRRGRKRVVMDAVTGSLLQRILPSQIELMEVYKGPASMPAEFIDDSCAAIAIWTR